VSVKKFKVVDLFAGCGGMSLGLEKAGFNVVGGYDWWQPAVDTYNKNLSHPCYKHDLADIAATVAELEKQSPDLVVGGPPCQDFSSAGKREEGTRANLTVAYAESICQYLPSYFIMENVSEAPKSKAFASAEALWTAAGYGMTKLVLDASLCGVPQKRKRFFCIGGLGEAPDFLRDALVAGLSEKPMTVREYLGTELGVDAYYRHPRNYNRRAVFSIDEPAPTIRGVNRPVPPGYTRHSIDAADPASVRPLTAEERGRIQTFPLGFSFEGSKADCNQMVGNAVPVELGHYVGRILLAHMRERKKR
jgi:DNA (cytosine-5)-methyltransferase 1